jgi:prepilin-type N-terminal cleavage/methylation domain-containing protein
MRRSFVSKTADHRGFTIVEVLVATAVFSTILLISLTGFLQIGQLFYKGVTVTRTQESARQAMDSLAADIRFASSISQSTAQPAGGSGGAASAQYFCTGSNRYTFIPGRQVNTSDYNMSDKFGLIKDELPLNSACASPFGSAAVAFNNPVELLGNKMRVGNLAISQLTDPGLNKLYTINVKIAYGDDNILENPSTVNVSCNSTLKTSQYCYVADLKTTVRRGF